MTQSYESKLKRPPTAYAGMTIGILGGSFNPPHQGHKHISEIALKRLGLTRLWWLVTPGNPIKSHDELAPLERRIEMSEALLQNPKIDVTAFEAAYPTAHTAQTLKRLKAAYRGPKFVWIMGADNLRTIHKWNNWRDIFCTFPILIIDRPEERFKAINAKAAMVFRSAYLDESDAKGLAHRPAPCWSFLTVKPSDLSSTQIRNNDANWHLNR